MNTNATNLRESSNLTDNDDSYSSFGSNTSSTVSTSPPPPPVSNYKRIVVADATTPSVQKVTLINQEQKEPSPPSYRRMSMPMRKTSVVVINNNVRAEANATDSTELAKKELTNELKSRLNPKPGAADNKSRSIINGRLLLKNIENELKDELESIKIKSTISPDYGDNEKIDKSTELRTTPSYSSPRAVTSLSSSSSSYTPKSSFTTMNTNVPTSPTARQTVPNLRNRKFSQDSSMISIRQQQQQQQRPAQSRTFNLLKETLDNGLVQKDAVFRDSITNKRSVRRCSLTVTAGTLETAKIIEEEEVESKQGPNDETEQRTLTRNNYTIYEQDSSPTSPTKVTNFNHNHTDDNDNEYHDIVSDMKNSPDLKTRSAAPRSMSLVDDRLMSLPRNKVAYHLSRLSVDYGDNSGGVGVDVSKFNELVREHNEEEEEEEE